VETILFRSPYILRTLGFNARQIVEGFYATQGARPFAVDTLADFFAGLSPETFLMAAYADLLGRPRCVMSLRRQGGPTCRPALRTEIRLVTCTTVAMEGNY